MNLSVHTDPIQCSADTADWGHYDDIKKIKLKIKIIIIIYIFIYDFYNKLIYNKL